MERKIIPASTYLNPERDAVILTWLEGCDNKSAAIRDVLWQHVQHRQYTKPHPGPAPIDLDAIRAVILAALEEKLSLTLLRQVVEAGVGQALAGLHLEAATPPTEDERLDDLLAGLDDDLVID